MIKVELNRGRAKVRILFLSRSTIYGMKNQMKMR